jgi:UDP-N-acetylglucosamine--dolichyl-phosphate N-acetylglucosaminephosphotransferase
MLEIVLIGMFCFVLTLALMPWLGSKLRAAGICGEDMHKKGRPKLPEMGGIGVVIGFFAGLFMLILFNRGLLTTQLSAALIAILGAAFVGVIDDLINMRHRIKALLPFLFGLPLAMAVTDTTLYLPLMGQIDIGIVMILLIPLAITSAANVTNMLEGFNGLSTGLGIIICIVLSLIAVIQGAFITLYLISPLLGALLAFLYFNKYPAKIFPGDSLTLFMGATIATAAILGKLEFFGALLFIPMIIEFMLKIHGKYSNEHWPASFGKLDSRGFLRYNGPVESLTHWLMKRRRYREADLVLTFWIAELVLGVAVLLLYSGLAPP